MIRVHRRRYSALRVEGVCVSTKTVECGGQAGHAAAPVVSGRRVASNGGTWRTPERNQ